MTASRIEWPAPDPTAFDLAMRIADSRNRIHAAHQDHISAARAADQRGDKRSGQYHRNLAAGLYEALGLLG